MHHLEPVTHADRHYSKIDRDARALDGARKWLRSEMLDALKGDISKRIPCPGSNSGSFRPAIDVAFENASEEQKAAMLMVFRAGAAGNDVQILCSALLSMIADTHGETYCDAAFLAEEESL